MSPKKLLRALLIPCFPRVSGDEPPVPNRTQTH